MTDQQVEVRVEFPVLDTLRAVGALAVLTTHTAFQAGDYLRYGYFGTFLARLDVGVAVFFVLSGFLLSRPWIARASLAAPKPSTLRYYEKRLLRIYPVYVVSVVAALLLIPENGRPDLLQWLITLFMADSLVGGQLPHGLTQMWSLAVEVAFYILLPLLMHLAARRGRLRPQRLTVVLTSMVFVSVIWHLQLSDAIAPHTKGLTGIWLPAYLTWFAAGIALAWAHVRLQQPEPPRALRLLPEMARLPGVCWSMVAGLMLISATPVGGPTIFQVGTAAESLSKHLIYAAVGGLVVMTGVWTTPSSAYTRVMSSRIPRHLGQISYSLFCLHVSVITLVMWLTGYALFDGHGLQIWVLTLAISLVLAELSYRVVEMPFLRLKARWSSRPRTVSEATVTRTADSAS